MSNSTDTYQSYLSAFANLQQQPVYGLNQRQKEQYLFPALHCLHQHHQFNCIEYKNMTQFTSNDIQQLANLPFLAVKLFKQLRLQSVENSQIYKVLQSSGTTAAQPAQVFLDKDTSARQSKVLVKILQESIGKQRLPMLIIDCPSVLKDKAKFSARGAGIQGLAFFGRDHTYALNDDMQPNWPAVNEFTEKYAGQPVLLFGFTFMVWLYFIQALQQRKQPIDLSQGILLHSGGWKKLEDQKVDNSAFKQALEQVCGIQKSYNFYGMAEQVGSVFVECDAGHLHTPSFADVIVRDPYTFSQSEVGQTGLIQVLSALPSSYPGHSLLTEDLGSIIGIDNCPCGRMGKIFTVHGRLPKTEVRGCSDTHQAVRA